ncbi:secretion protein, partial [bacterium]|nr:secretion protein [bacterium]
FNKVPFLGDLPVLGKLFQSVSKSKIETEVVIFLKAKLVK